MDVVATLKLKKCHSSSESIDCVKHVIAPGRLQVAGRTTDAIAELWYSKKMSKIKSFGGLQCIQIICFRVRQGCRAVEKAAKKARTFTY